jgi:hypothetical protein
MPVVGDLPVLHAVYINRAEPNLATIAFQVFEPAGEMSGEDVSNNSAVLWATTQRRAFCASNTLRMSSTVLSLIMSHVPRSQQGTN